jgi:flagellar biosynthetic protein FliR
MTPEMVASFLVSLSRTVAFLQAAPIVGDRIVPPRMRVTVAIMIAFAISTARGPMDLAAVPLAVPGEILLGAAAGFAGRLVIAGAEIGGQLISLHVGLGFAGNFDPVLGDMALAVRRIAWCFAGLAFLGAGGLETGVLVLAHAPVDGRTLATAVSSIVHGSGQMLVSAIRFAAPAMLASLVVYLAAGLASRAAPALNVFSVMFAVLILVGGIILLASAPAFAREISVLGRSAAEAGARTVGL